MCVVMVMQGKSMEMGGAIAVPVGNACFFKMDLRRCVAYNHGTAACSSLMSRVRKSIVWIFKLLFERQLQSCIHALEKEMATHSSVLAWRIPGTVEPGGLLSVGSHRVGHD